MTSFSIKTFGCRVNQAEAFSWANEFQKHGLEYKKDFSQSDLVLINTCTLTSRADSDVRGFIKKVGRLNPKARLIITGCYAEREPEELINNSQVYRVFSNTEKGNLAAEVLSVADDNKETSILPFRSRALVKIQDGCNFRCSFCIIPSVRGRSVSVEKEEILNQVREFINQGFKEIVLTGIHLCSYGLDLEPRSSFMDLLQEIENLDGFGRMRLSSLDPRFLNFPLLKHVTSSEKICPHFHLSLQNGSDEIIHRMGRKIDVGNYRRILAYLHQKSPLASLGADIIVGFPGESEADFGKTYSFLRQSPLTYFHVFSYSARPGTEASKWIQIDNKKKKERASFLRSLSQEKNVNFRRRFKDKECEAIIIKKGKKGAQVLTANYIKVFIPYCPEEEKREIRVKITRVTHNETIGQIV